MRLYYEGHFLHMQAKIQRALELSLSYQEKYDKELRDYIRQYNLAHPENRIRRNGTYYRSVKKWDESLEEYLEICIEITRLRICGTNVTWSFQSSFLSRRRHYLLPDIINTIRSVFRNDKPVPIVQCAIDKCICPSVLWRWYQSLCESLFFLTDMSDKRCGCMQWLASHTSPDPDCRRVKQGVLWDGSP